LRRNGGFFLEPVRACGRFAVIVLEALHEWRGQQAARFLAENAHLLASVQNSENAAARTRVATVSGSAKVKPPPAGSNGRMTGLVVIALALFALHVMCAAAILDRSSANAHSLSEPSYTD